MKVKSKMLELGTFNNYSIVKMRVMDLPTFEILETAGTSLQRTKDNENELSVEGQKELLCGVGMLLCLVKSSRPSITNECYEQA